MSFLDPDDDKKNDGGGDGDPAKTTVTSYALLQRQSPMTSAIGSNRFRSNHRVLGNIVNALINLQKYTVSDCADRRTRHKYRQGLINNCYVSFGT